MVISFFIDFETAFDSIDREAFWHKPLTVSASSKLVNLMHAYHNLICACIRVSGEESTPFLLTTGFCRDCQIFSVIFKLFIDWMMNQSIDSSIGCQVTPTFHIKDLYTVDDIVVLKRNQTKSIAYDQKNRWFRCQFEHHNQCLKDQTDYHFNWSSAKIVHQRRWCWTSLTITLITVKHPPQWTNERLNQSSDFTSWSYLRTIHLLRVVSDEAQCPDKATDVPCGNQVNPTVSTWNLAPPRERYLCTWCVY